MAEYLKDQGHEAIAIGIAPQSYKRLRFGNKDKWQGLDINTLLTFTKWADKIIDMSDGFRTQIPYNDTNKYERFYIGPDIYFSPRNKLLRILVRRYKI